jgi:hypothetical protein
VHEAVDAVEGTGNETVASKRRCDEAADNNELFRRHDSVSVSWDFFSTRVAYCVDDRIVEASQSLLSILPVCKW